MLRFIGKIRTRRPTRTRLQRTASTPEARRTTRATPALACKSTNLVKYDKHHEPVAIDVCGVPVRSRDEVSVSHSILHLLESQGRSASCSRTVQVRKIKCGSRKSMRHLLRRWAPLYICIIIIVNELVSFKVRIQQRSVRRKRTHIEVVEVSSEEEINQRG